MNNIKIVKLDQVAEPKVEKPKGGKLAKTMKTFPRGVLRQKTAKIIPVSDPAKSPPVKKSMRKHTIRLFTPLGEKRRQKTIKKRVSRMSDKQVTSLITKHNLLKNESTPSRIKREMLAGAMMAGFISDT
jgi:hypothetical protein